MVKPTKRTSSKRRIWPIFLLIFFIGSCVHFFFFGGMDYLPVTSLDEIVKMAQQQSKDEGLYLSANETEGEREGSSKSVQSQSQSQPDRVVAGLSCKRFGAPSDEVAAEMVYWEDIPSDSSFVSPLKTYTKEEPKYLTFEPDEGGWNNIRMGMETAVTMALAMGRILVIPPEVQMYLLWEKKKNQKHHFSFRDFFHFDLIENEHASVEVIAFDTFLWREGMAGKLRNKQTGQVSFPPQNRTNWNGQISNFPDGSSPRKVLYDWIRSVTNPVEWHFHKCVVGLPDTPGPLGVAKLQKAWDRGCCNRTFPERNQAFEGNPIPVDSSAEMRLEEILAHRKELCMYNEELQNEKVIHLQGENDSVRMLIHFYAFLWFQDYHQDLWTKRFVRDHLRYLDMVQCQAARIVGELRVLAKKNGNPSGAFDTMHIRRGDFQYKDTRIDASEIFESSKPFLAGPNSTVFIATDERNKSFFKIFKDHYNVYFLDDFQAILTVNTNYYGMLDQLIASRGRNFIGTYFSTFTGFINRMRGYHSTKAKTDGYQKGILNSYYYVPPAFKNVHRTYHAIHGPMWAREFPVAWRDIDHDINEALQ